MSEEAGSPAQPRTLAPARYAKPLFLATIVTGSFLLFLTQPLVARMALPRVGGAPAVWNSAMLVYQALLLGGYAYAHFLGQLRPRLQAGLHLSLFALAALWLPIGLIDAVPPGDRSTAFWVPWFLVASIGPLFFIISAQAPLMQRWYALETSRGDPYALYAASNLGSFAGLISYPLLVEPLLTLEQQSGLWTGGYAVLVALVVACALTIPAQVVEERPQRLSPPAGAKRVLHWIVLAAVPSGLMLSTTTHLTTDIVAIPLLWVVPLGLYLLSFVVAFASRRGPTEFITQLSPLIILIAGGLAFADGSTRPIFSATLGLSLLFVIAVTLHGEMYRLRPEPDRLTGFYLSMSLGGVIGGALVAIVAPLVFDWAYEHPLLIVAAAFLLPLGNYFSFIERLWQRRKLRGILTLAIPTVVFLLSLAGDRKFWPDVPNWANVAAPALIGLIAVFSIGRRSVYAACLVALMMSYGGWSTLKLSLEDVRTRSYFGIYTVSTRPGGSARVLTHGTTVHGVQSLRPGMETQPTSYYTSMSGVGLALAHAAPLYGPAARIGVIGLGTGTLACYRLPGQSWTFFEIDPAIVRIARDPTRFTFLSRCAPDARVILGDARLTMAKQPPHTFDMIAVDAFSSDAVPMHLLTREALEVYGRALQPRGLLLMHISNRYLDLEPVLAAGARTGGWHARILRYSPELTERLVEESHPSVWIAMSRDPATLGRLVSLTDPDGWQPLEQRPGFAGWTDDYASILPLLKKLTN
jgi:SAM-dependent methyltransferase